jgi:hypothetical protein
MGSVLLQLNVVYAWRLANPGACKAQAKMREMHER